MPTVSIIIPVYKAEHYLDACVRSVVGQSCTDLEILLVDDGSPDRSPEMCDAWAARDPRVRVLHRKNGGAASARNAGLDAATGDFIFFADADDLLEPDAIEYLVKAGQQYGTDLVIGNMLYVMLGLFVASMAYFILIIRKETKARKQKLMENFGIDLIPYVRYSQASIILLYFAAGLLPVAILFNTLLYIIGPLILLSVIFFVHTFIAMGYYITPKEVIPEENDAEAKVTEAEDMKDGKNTHGTNILTANRKMEIELALKKWCEEGFYKDYEVNIYSLATKLGYKKNELTEYFNQSEYTNFRTWLSDIRFNEAVRMMKANPEYSIDAISTECGFSSHTWIYRIFKQKTGMSPSQWRKQFASI